MVFEALLEPKILALERRFADVGWSYSEASPVASLRRIPRIRVVCNKGECRPIDPRELQDVQNSCNPVGGLTIMSFGSCLVSRTPAISGFGSLGRVGYASVTGPRAIRWRGLASIATDKQQKVWAQQPSVPIVIARNANAQWIS